MTWDGTAEAVPFPFLQMVRFPEMQRSAWVLILPCANEKAYV
jgi:hypothetical protein